MLHAAPDFRHLLCHAFPNEFPFLEPGLINDGQFLGHHGEVFAVVALEGRYLLFGIVGDQLRAEAAFSRSP